MANSSWLDFRTQFLRGASEHPGLSTLWNAGQKQWTFLDGTPEAERLFQDAARSAVGLLASSTDPEALALIGTAGKPWHIWLDFMRVKNRGFRSAQMQPPGWRQVSTIAEAGESLSSLIGSSLNGILDVFSEAAEFCADLHIYCGRVEPPPEPSLNITERQLQLLRVLVTTDEVTGGKEFYFAQNVSGSGICYPGGPAPKVDCTKADFYQLEREHLIVLQATGDILRGQPTQLGILTVRNDGRSLRQERSDDQPPGPAEARATRYVSDVQELPSLTPDADERIERARKDAASYLRPSSSGLEEKQNAILNYFDAMAWEYVRSRPAGAFEGLIDVIGEKAMSAFDGRADLESRKQCWIAEARDRAANGIVGDIVPLRIDQRHAGTFHELEGQFRQLPGSGPDLQATFTDGGHRDIRPGPPDLSQLDQMRRRFEQLARQAMVALGFRFSDSARPVQYWMDLLRQENPRLRSWLIPRLCFESAELCLELETRALEGSTRAAALRPAETPAESLATPLQLASTRQADGAVRDAVEIGQREPARREQLLAEYKRATGDPSNRSIYFAHNSGIHKPEFYSWLKGELPASSQTAMNFERFLKEKKPPIPRDPK